MYDLTTREDPEYGEYVIVQTVDGPAPCDTDALTRDDIILGGEVFTDWAMVKQATQAYRWALGYDPVSLTIVVEGLPLAVSA